MRLSGWQIPKSQLSASSLALAIQCPEQFRIKHILKVPEKTFSDRFLGRVDHDSWAAFFAWKKDLGKPMDLATLKSTYVTQWERHLANEEEPVVWKEGENPEKFQETGLKMIDAYYPLAEKIEPLGVEQRFEGRIPEVPVPIIGYVDLEEKFSIIERKTAKQKVSKPKPTWRMQGRIYSLFVGKPVDWHVVTKQVTPKVYTPEEEPALRMEPWQKDQTVRMIQQTAHRLNDLYARYGPDTPWPTDGIFRDWLCDFCSFGPIRGNRSCIAWRTT